MGWSRTVEQALRQSGAMTRWPDRFDGPRSFAGWAYDAGREMGDGVELCSATLTGEGSVLIVTTAQDADGFTAGVVDGLVSRSISCCLWCIWFDTIPVDADGILTASTPVRQYRDVFPESFSDVLVCSALVSTPGPIRTMLSMLEEMDRENPSRLPSVLQIWSALIALDTEFALADLFSYLAARTRWLSSEIDVGARRRKAAFSEVPTGLAGVSHVPGLVLKAKEQRPKTSLAFGP